MLATLAHRATDVLRAGIDPDLGRAPRIVVGARWLLIFIVLFGMSYGAVMGAFSGITGDGWLQMIYSACKVPLLLLVTFALSLPSFFVLNTLLGLRADFRDATIALINAQAALTIVLASLAPFTMVWYRSSTDYQEAVLFNGVMFAIASFSAQILVRRMYRPLIQRDPRHKWMLRAWLITFTFVGIQLGWTLRPFIGNPDTPARFFRENAFEGNAYVVIFDLILRTLRAVFT